MLSESGLAIGQSSVVRSLHVTVFAGWAGNCTTLGASTEL